MEEVLANRYRVLATIGRGGMGEVLRVEDLLQEGRIVALKRFRLENAALALPFLSREFLTLAKLRHPNIASVFDFGVVPRGEGAPVEAYFTAELVGGIDLFRATEDASWDELYDLFVQVCRGLAYVHSRGIIHRDMKPSNVLVARVDGRPIVKIIDFGLALATRPDSWLPPDDATAPIRGTVHYLAPEVIRGGPIDRRADLYSLGVTAFEIATRARPFAGGSSREVIRRHLSDPPPRPRAVRPDVPAPLERVILRLLEKEPAARFGSADAVIRELSRLSGRLFAVETPETSESWVRSGRFVGREAELARLREWFSSCGGAPIFVVSGEAGLGKSRLLREFKHWVQVAGGGGELRAPVETIEVFCAEPPRASGPIAEAVRRLLRLVGPDVEALLGPSAPLVRRFAGELPPAPPGSPSSGERRVGERAGDPGRERLRLLDAVVTFILAATWRRPALLLIYDLHLADDETIALLSHLARAAAAAGRGEAEPRVARRSGLLVLATSRIPAAGAGQLAALAEEGLLESIALRPLEPAEVAELAATMLGVPRLPPELERFLVQKGGGNPFFVAELMKSLLEAGAVRIDRGNVRLGVLEAQPAPASLTEVCRARLQRLDADERAAIEVLAAAREPAPLALVEAASGRPRAAIAACIERLEERGILVRTGRSPPPPTEPEDPRFGFAHEILRETVYGEIPEARRAALHGAIAEAILAAPRSGGRPAEGELALLAEHFAKAGIVDRAFFYSVRAAREAASLFANDRAIALYRRALSLADAAGAAPAAVIEVLEALGRAYERIGKYDDAGGVYAAILGHKDVAEILDPAGLARIHRRFGETLEARGEYDSATDNFAAGARLLGAEDPTEAIEGARLRGATASVYVKLGRYDDAIEFGRSGLALVEGRAAPEVEAALLNTIGIALSGKGDYERAADHFERSLALREALDDPEGEAKTLNNLGAVFAERGQLGRAIAYFEQALERGERGGDVRGTAETAANLGSAYGALGDDDRALRCFQRAVELLERLGDSEAIAGARVRLGTLLCDLGDFEGAAGSFERASRVFRRLGETREAAGAEILAGRLCAAVGAYEEARAALERALRIAARFQAKREEAAALHLFGRIGRAQGRLDEAERALQRSHAIYGQLGNDVEAALVRIEMLELLLDRGDLALAQIIGDALEESVRDARAGRLLAPFEAAAGRLFAAAGKPAEGARRLDRARELARDGRRPDLVWRAEHALGLALEAAGAPERALAALVRGMEAVRELYQRVPARWREAFLADPARQALRRDFLRLRAATSGETQPSSR